MNLDEPAEVRNRNGTESGLVTGESEETRSRAVLKLFAEFYGLDGLPAWDEVGQLDGYHQLELRGGTERIYINRYEMKIKLLGWCLGFGFVGKSTSGESS